MGLLKTQKEIDDMSKDELFAEAIRLAELAKKVRRYGRGYLKKMEMKHSRHEERMREC